MKSSTARLGGIGLLLALGLGLGACASPTAPRLPEPDDKSGTPKDDEGSARRWSADLRTTMTLLDVA